LVAVEVHKRLDPFYADARDRVRAGLGDFQYMVRIVYHSISIY
jgi:D-galacturonate reductase